MTAPLTRYRQDPEYLNMVKRLKRMGQNEKAVFDTLIADESFADREMRSNLAAMRFAAQYGKEGAVPKRLALRKSEIGLRGELGRGRLDISRGQVALGGRRVALREQKQIADIALARGEQGLRRDYFGLGKEQAGFAKKQGRVATAIAGLDVGLSIPTAFGTAELKKQELEELRGLRRLYGTT